MGDYDEDEHERREAKATVEEAEVDDDRTQYEGTREFAAGDDADALIDQFKEINS
jgi:hypothetical protein